MTTETRRERMHRLLTAAFSPILLEIEDESGKHAGHSGSRASGETHYRVKIISPAFAGLTKIACHRAVYAALAEEMQEGGIHALALDIPPLAHN